MSTGDGYATAREESSASHIGMLPGGAEIAGLDIAGLDNDGPVWQRWTEDWTLADGCVSQN